MAGKKKESKAENSKIEHLFILDEETQFLFEENEYGKNRLIVSEDSFRKNLDHLAHAKNIIVLVELDWHNSTSQFYGYEVAKELMNAAEGRNFGLVFISTLSRDLIYKLNSGKNRIFTQKFPHIAINADFDLKTISIPDLSQRKFDYLKNYCLLESGILDRIEHDIRPLLLNLDPIKLQRLISDLRTNSDILSNEVLNLLQKINRADEASVKDILNQIHWLIQELQAQFNHPEESANKKSRNTVMLLEDDPETLEKLHALFAQYFSDIRPFKSGKLAFEELEKNAKEYDVVITDMELLDGNFDDEKLGIDILELCDQKFPFLVTRVITALPKNALSKLIKKTNLGEIIYKSNSRESIIPPFENLVEFVQQINKDVKKRQLLKAIRGPINSWWGKYLTKELYLVQLNNQDEYSVLWEKAKITAAKFLNGELDKLSINEKLDVEFKRIKEISNNPEVGWEIIQLLLIHRLIVLGFAAKNDWEFYYSGDGKDVYTNFQGFKKGMETKPSKVYFNTILGFSAEDTLPIWEDKLKCSIIPKNLFPEEVEWLGNIREEFLDKIPLLDVVDEALYNFVEKLGEANGIKTNAKETTYEDGLNILRSIIQKAKNGTLDAKTKVAIKTVYKLDFEFLGEDMKPEPKVLIEQLRAEI